MVQFLDTLPDTCTGKVTPVNKNKPEQYSRKVFIIFHKNEEEKVFEMGYEYHCSPFSDALILNNIIAVGYEHTFCLFDLTSYINLAEIQMNGYFGHIYIHEDHFYVTDASGMYCISQNGRIKWKNQNLAVDGVIINEFLHDRILISGEWNPPSGWKNASISITTGQSL